MHACNIPNTGTCGAIPAGLGNLSVERDGERHGDVGTLGLRAGRGSVFCKELELELAAGAG
jgi:hypothetical protein